MRRLFAFGLTLAGASMVLVTSSCNRSMGTSNREKGSNSVAIATKEGSQKDTMLLPMQFKIEEMGDFNKNQPRISINYRDTKYFYILDGEVVPDKKKDTILRNLPAQSIKSFEFIRAGEAVERYGPKAANGAIIIETERG